VAITDALDMKALDQGPNQVLDALAALRAGVDLLLLATDEEGRERITTGVRHAARRRLLDANAVDASLARVATLRRRVTAATDPLRRPDLSVVGGAGHLALSRELADRSLTLVRDDDGLLPLHLDGDRSILAVMPRPVDLTPADTSSTVEPGLAAALRAVHSRVDDVTVDIDPDDASIGAVRARAAAADAVVVGTIAAAAGSAQARLVEAILGTGTPTITVALRTPWDLDAYPGSRTHLCTYSILPDPLAALADAVVGRLVPAGRLPVPLAAARVGAVR
jgi:beta-N-acetylhexosaminidase